MIVLDTNVLSELLVEWQAERRVLTWVRSLRRQPVTTALNRAELLAGAALLPTGRRRTDLLDGIERVLSGLDTLPFTPECATAYAGVLSARTASGRPIATMDALIASIALVHGASVATRDVDGFAGVGLEVVDPWSEA